MYKMGLRPLVLLTLTAFLCVAAQKDEEEFAPDDVEPVTIGGSEEKNVSTLSGLPITLAPGSEKTQSDEDSKDSSFTSSRESNSTEDDGPEADDSNGKDFLEMLTLIGIIVGAIVAVVIVLTIIVIIIKKMSGGYSP
ncbi:podoplanin isoform X1 [Amblyraja radiata]|uniref:podoplanin isoform X1 n=1 Tax=Amblyraja radiata TaxID=386614 RepID=UPI001401FFC2|nr:podoplanin isoform X1 [Amblyraja radiata]